MAAKNAIGHRSNAKSAPQLRFWNCNIHPRVTRQGSERHFILLSFVRSIAEGGVSVAFGGHTWVWEQSWVWPWYIS